MGFGQLALALVPSHCYRIARIQPPPLPTPHLRRLQTVRAQADLGQVDHPAQMDHPGQVVQGQMVGEALTPHVEHFVFSL
jgi:hypothetical protein